MRESYLDYSMSVIVSRALPDVRDGLKPVHRRILYGMHELGMAHNKAYKKSARIVGEVLGKYHPHGDTAVYDSMVRMAQTFSLRYPLVDGQGNFGSIDGDRAAAMRYTEARMKLLSEFMLQDIEKDTVDFRPNFDDSLKEPTVLPAKVPNLLINGSSGIAVGMATNIPPHNLDEIIQALVHVVDNPECDVEELLEFVKGPDFPTAGQIFGVTGFRQAYRTGRGKVIIRAKYEIEELKNGKEQIVITEIPYQVNKSNVVEKIAALVRHKEVDGITDLRDESDKDGIRIVIELRKDVYPMVVMNLLFKHTQLQNTFGIIMLALDKGIPKVMNLKEMLVHFIDYRHEVIVRRTQFELRKTEEQAHILAGLKIALDNLDEVIKTIKEAPDVATARARLIEKFSLSEIQAKAILEMRLQKLTGMEREKIIADYDEKLRLIEKLKFILSNRDKRMEIMKGEFSLVHEKFADVRRTEVLTDSSDLDIEDMIAEEDMVITISHSGYIKRSPVSDYRSQTRGGTGSRGAMTKDDDFIENIFIASTHDYLLFFTNYGKLYWLKVHGIPIGTKISRGRAIVNLLACDGEEKVRAFLNVREFSTDKYVVMATKKGVIKKTPLSAFSRPRVNGIIALNIRDEDDIVGVDITSGSDDIVLGTREGKAIRFNESKVRPMGRTATGVRGVTLNGDDDAVIDMVVVSRPEANLLAVSEKGLGKRSGIEDYRITNRGGKGVITLKSTEKTGKLVALKEVVDTDDLMIITTNGTLIRMAISTFRVIARNTQGVKLINLRDGDSISSVTRIAVTEEDETEDKNQTENTEETRVEVEKPEGTEEK
ncbi:MAG: DNA gyrase subunit A [Candidatus Marinimicrobia bacterium]|nr:DNA gyrase subunit A [Candidatus Neomarinimicrobiota bacterium]